MNGDKIFFWIYILMSLFWALLHRYQGKNEAAIDNICGALVFAAFWAILHRVHRSTDDGAGR